jgi:phosphoribosylformylglycinamidine cyclo-ligase
MSEQDAYVRAGVSQRHADASVTALVAHLRQIDPGRDSRAVPLPGQYASVIRATDTLGIAFATDGVGTKMVVAEQLGRFDTIGIDCIAMNVNDLICVGAEPIALLDFILCSQANPEICDRIGAGLREGAELAGVEIPGGEIAQVGDVVSGWELSASAIGFVDLDAIITGAAVQPGDALIGLPSSGLHSNGYTLARRVLADVPFDDVRLGRPLGEILLEPTTIYVRAVFELLRSPVDVRGLWTQQPPAAGRRRRLRDRLADAGSRDLRPDPGTRRGRRRRDARGLQHGARLRVRRRRGPGG